jgi:hypothetical protein
LTVSLIVAVNVATAVFADARTFALTLHVPSLNFRSSPENMNTAVPVPVAPANLPVLVAPSTVKGAVVAVAYRQVLADFRPPVLVPALSRVTTRLPTAVLTVYDVPFSGEVLSEIVAVVPPVR